MIEKTRGIVLRNTNYRDNSVISHVYTQEFGIQSYMLNGVRNQKGAIRPSHLMPLNLLDLVVYKKPTSSIQRIKELRCNPILTTIHFDVLKNSIALFIAEILNASLSEEEPNPELFQFLEHFIHILDLEDDKIANYPIYFLIHLTRYLGFFPKGTYADQQVFNLKEGMFVDNVYLNTDCVDSDYSEWWWTMLNSSLDEWTSRYIDRDIRNNLLNQLLLYYEHHGLHGRKIKSHKVLREVLR
ncbi:MAG: DNA repair protein RecO [Bacteroidia bacterium]|nr:DNA repair protein RecO [Bacteroidia bacterium]